jgi:hypothetical protein
MALPLTVTGLIAVLVITITSKPTRTVPWPRMIFESRLSFSCEAPCDWRKTRKTIPLDHTVTYAYNIGV